MFWVFQCCLTKRTYHKIYLNFCSTGGRQKLKAPKIAGHLWKWVINNRQQWRFSRYLTERGRGTRRWLGILRKWQVTNWTTHDKHGEHGKTFKRNTRPTKTASRCAKLKDMGYNRWWPFFLHKSNDNASNIWCFSLSLSPIMQPTPKSQRDLLWFCLAIIGNIVMAIKHYQFL